MENLEIKKTIPKQFPDEEAFEMAVITATSVQMAANSAFMSQFIVTILLAVSLKAMWNLMHVLQVISYLRFATVWPANA